MKMRSRTVSGDKSRPGMWAGVMLSGSGMALNQGKLIGEYSARLHFPISPTASVKNTDRLDGLDQ